MKLGLPNFQLSSPSVKALFAVVSAVLILIISGFILANKEVTLSVDGKSEHLVTRASTVAELLAEKEITVSARDEVSPTSKSPLYPETKVTVRHAVPLFLDVNGKKRKIWTVASNVGEVVENLGIDTSADIKLLPSARSELSSGMTIRLRLLNRWIEKVQTEIAYETKRVDDARIDKGKTRVAQKGRLGTKETVIEHVMAGGQEVEKIVHGEDIIAAPVSEILKVGTRVPRAVAPGSSGPSVTASRGGRSLVMQATAYAANTGGAGSRTATGTGVYKGIVAVDPRIIPLGTRLYIDGYGPAVAADTGGAIKGNRIDLGFGSAGEAYQFGRRSVTVHIVN